MLLVKTALKTSTINGLGLFAAEFIPAGTKVWQYCEGFDHRLSLEFVEALPEPGRSTVLHYSACWGGGFVVSADDARFLNHSDTPNLRTTSEPDADWAIRDIQIGEELLENYQEFDETFGNRIGCTEAK
jgi:SET domain-containing protein